MTCQALPPDPSISSGPRRSKDPQMAETIISLLRSKVTVAVIKTQGPCDGRSWHQHTARAVNKHWELYKHCFILCLLSTRAMCLVPYAGLGMEAPSGHWNSGAPKSSHARLVGKTGFPEGSMVLQPLTHYLLHTCCWPGAGNPVPVA